MDSFREPFWNLDQVRCWAETRDSEMVRAAALPKSGKPKTSAELPALCREVAAALNRTGRDMQAELRAASGGLHGSPGSKPGFDLLDPKVPFEESFTLHFIETLFRAGTLKAAANLPGDPRAYELSLADWADLEIAVGGDSQRLGVWRKGGVRKGGAGDFESVRAEREAVLKAFPADPAGIEYPQPFPAGRTPERKQTKPEAAAEILRQRDPGKRPSSTIKQLARELKVSESTVKRAIALAWPKRVK
jgi:hypothetical protein